MTQDRIALEDRTPWFPATVKPVRPGVYEVMTPAGIGLPWLSEFHKGKWLGTVARDNGPERAVTFGRKHGPSDANITLWRGLTTKAAKAARSSLQEQAK